jgi:hypothetical protein
MLEVLCLVDRWEPYVPSLPGTMLYNEQVYEEPQAQTRELPAGMGGVHALQIPSV